MLRLGFELMTPVFERAKTVHALDRAAAVIGQVFGIKLYITPVGIFVPELW
jgi:hypothetical protein